MKNIPKVYLLFIIGIILLCVYLIFSHKNSPKNNLVNHSNSSLQTGTGNPINTNSFPHGATSEVVSDTGSKIQIINDIVYAQINSQNLGLDLYISENDPAPHPLLIFVHGGGFTAGDKANDTKMSFQNLASNGFAVASVNYRLLTDTTPYPDQLYDVKGAIRFLKANAKEFGLDQNRFAIMGTSAGGILASIIGTTANVKDLEGTTGGNLDFSSSVNAVVVVSGSLSIENAAGLADHQDLKAGLVLGCDPGASSCAEKVKWFMPETYADQSDPPYWIGHGQKDATIPVVNANAFYSKLLGAGVSAELHIGNTGHGGVYRMYTKEIIAFVQKELGIQ